MPSTAIAGRTSFLPFCCNQEKVSRVINAGNPLFQAFSPIPVLGSTDGDCIKVSNDDILLVIAQTVFSAVVIEDAIRLIIFTQRIKTLYEEAYCELITIGISTTAQRVWLKYFCVEYESIKAHYRIRLSEPLFNKLNPQLSETWEKLSSQIKVSTDG